MECLPDASIERTRDAIQIDWDGERGIVLLITAEALELRLPTTEWAMGAYAPTAGSRLWRRIEWDDIEDDSTLMGWIKKAQKARLRQYHKCRYCGESFPPERRHRKDVCHGCAERHEGVVH